MNHSTSLPKGDIEFRLGRSRRTPARARELFRDQARCWKLAEEVTRTAELLLSELVTNAVLHGRVSPGREVWVRCALWKEGPLRVEVMDADKLLPAPRQEEPAEDDENGRGLRIVSTLADRWDAHPRECGIGKTVWFELDGAWPEPEPGGSTRRPSP